MRHLTAALLLAVCATVGAAQDTAKKYDLLVPDRWEVGEVVTWTEVEKGKQTMAMQREGAAGREQVKETSEESVIVWRCLEVDDKGALRRAHAYVKSWSRKEGAAEDTSVAGAFVEVTPGKWTLLSPDVEPSAKGTEWLNEEFGPKSDARKSLAESLAPEGPVAVGTKWTRSFEALMQLLEQEKDEPQPLPFDMSKIEVHLTLEDARETPDGVSARAAFQVDSPLTGDMSAGGATVPLGEGSTMKIDGTTEGLLGRAHRNSTTQATMAMQINVDMGGVTMAVKGTMQQNTTHVAGGEMPEPPKAPAEAPDPSGSSK